MIRFRHGSWLTSMLRTARKPHLRRKRRPGSAKVQPQSLQLEPLEPRILLNASLLDPAFGDEGLVITDFLGSASDSAAQVLMTQVDGQEKTIAVGSTVDIGGSQFALTRYNADGTLDASFGEDGRVTTGFGDGVSAGASGAVLDDQGRIVVAGFAKEDGAVETDLALARYNPDGTLDETFGEGGRIAVDLDGGSNESAGGIAIDGNGDIVVAGSFRQTTSDDFDFLVARFDAGTGDLDDDFGGGDGWVSTNMNTVFEGGDYARDVAVDSAGDIIVVGEYRWSPGTTGSGDDSHVALARYTSTGDLRLGFGENNDGKVITDFGTDDTAEALTLDGSGNILVAGSVNYDFLLARYDAEGDLDDSFGHEMTPGWTRTDFDGEMDEAQGLAIDTAGRIVVGGTAASYDWETYITSRSFALARYTGAGELDTTFGNDGTVTTAGNSTNGRSMALGENGIVLGGDARGPSGGSDFTLARHDTETGDADTTFGDGGTVTTDFPGSGTDIVIQATAAQENGKTLVAGQSNLGAGAFHMIVARYNADGSLDESFGGGDGWVDVRYEHPILARSMAVDSQGRIVAAGESFGDTVFARFTAEGELDTDFNGDGRMTSDIGGIKVVQDVTTDSDDRIVVTGGRLGEIFVARYDTDGTLDSGFGDGGWVTTELSGEDMGAGVTVDDEGRILVAAQSNQGTTGEDFALVRYDQNGALDTTFGDPDGSGGRHGYVITDFAGENDTAWDLEIDAEGGIIVAGASGGDRFALARYDDSGQLDAGFGEEGLVATAVGVEVRGGRIALDDQGRIVLGGSSTQEGTGEDFTLIRYHQDGTLDTTLDNDDGIVTTDFGSDLDAATSVVIDDSGRIVLAGATRQEGTGFDFALARYLPADDFPINDTEWIAGDDFRVNSHTADAQQAPSVAMDGDGNAVIVWTSSNQDGDAQGIYGQRYDAAGNPVGDEFLVNETTAGYQVSPSVAMNAGGDALITWDGQGEDGYGIYGRRFDTTSGLVGGAFRIDSPLPYDDLALISSVAMDAEGNALITWSTANGLGETKADIYGRWYDAETGLAGEQFLINTFTAENQQYVSVAMDAAGNAFVTWQSNHEDTDGDIYGRRYSADRTALDDQEFLINSTTEELQRRPSVAMGPDGSAIVAWDSFRQDNAGFNVYGQRYDAEGNAVGGEFRVSTITFGGHFASSVAIDGEGNALIAWNGTDADRGDVYGQRYDAYGRTVGDEFRINTTVPGAQWSPSVAMDADGGAMVAWFRFNASGDSDYYDVYARRFLAEADPTENQSPTADAGGSYVLNEGESLTLDASASSDPDGDPLSYAWEIDGDNGFDDAAGAQPELTWEQLRGMGIDDGIFTLAVRVDDGRGGTDLDTTTLTVNNLAPTANDDGYNTDEGQTLVVTTTDGLLDNDTDPGDDTLTAVLGSEPNNGTLDLNADGSFTYTPDQNFSGDDTFIYRAYDGAARSHAATVTITVNRVNQDPTADAGGFYEIDEGEDLTLDAGGSSDPDGDTLTYLWDLDGDGDFDDAAGAEPALKWEQLQDLNISGSDETHTLTVRVEDGEGGADIDTATITVNNLAPTANDNRYRTHEDQTLTVNTIGDIGVLHNDTDPGDDPLTAVLASGPENGTLDLNSDGSFTYAPDENFNGTDIFTYRAHDGQDESNLATVSIVVLPVNDAPVAESGSLTTDEDTPGTIDLRTLVSDVETDTGDLTFSVSDPINGTVRLQNDGHTARFAPGENHHGAAGFTYSVTDTGDGDDGPLTASANIDVAVNPVNDDPTTSGIDDVTVDEDASDTVIDLHAAFDDVEDADEDLTYSVPDNTNRGLFSSVAINGSDELILGYAENAFGSAVITVRATDTEGASVEAPFSVTVNPVNDAPTISDDSFSVDENSPEGTVVGVVTAEDVDDEPANLSYDITEGNDDGAFTIDGDGRILVANSDPLDYETTPTFHLTVRVADDGEPARSDTADITINLDDANETPDVADGQIFDIDENSSSGDPVGTVRASDPDEGDTLTYELTDGNGDGDDDGPFTIDPDTGVILVADASLLDHETTPTYNLIVRATDGDGLHDEAAVTVHVNEASTIGVSINDAAGAEGDNGRIKTTDFQFIVELTRPADRLTTVQWETADGSATAGEDYLAAGGTLEFLEGETRQTLNVTVLRDNRKESDETFYVNLISTSDPLVIDDGQAIGTIEDDDSKDRKDRGNGNGWGKGGKNKSATLDAADTPAAQASEKGGPARLLAANGPAMDMAAAERAIALAWWWHTSQPTDDHQARLPWNESDGDSAFIDHIHNATPLSLRPDKT